MPTDSRSTGSRIGRGLGIALLTPAALSALALAQATPGIELRGGVVAALDGTPVEGVRVTLFRRVPSGRNLVGDTMTDGRGAFTLRAPAPGDYTLSASRPPYGSGRYPGDPFSTSTVKWFVVSGPTAGIVVRLWEGPRVTGTVRDENDQPVAGASVNILQSIALGGRQVLQALNRSPTDTVGRYSRQVVFPGEYYLVVLPPFVPGGPTRPVQYYGNGRTPSQAVALELAASEVTEGIDFQLTRGRGFVISGVVDVPARLTRPSLLELYELHGDGLPTNLRVAVVALKDGRFAFPPVVAGSYEIRFAEYPQPPPDARAGPLDFNDRIARPGRIGFVSDEPTWWGATRVEVTDRDVTAVVDLQQGVRIRGRLVFEGEGPRPDPAVLPTRGVYLRSVDYRFFTPSPLASPREDGSFSTIGVPPGRYVLGVLDAYDGFQLRSVRIGNRDVTGVAFDLTRDVADAVLTFSPRVTAVTGRVAGERGEDRFVLLWPEDEAQWSASGTALGRFYRAVTDDGSYTLRVFPGTYRVAALPGAPPREWEYPAYLRSVYRFSERLVVPAGQTVVFHPPIVSRR